MNTIRIKKTELVGIIEQNKREHREIFLQAQNKYRERVIAELDSRLERARAGKNPALRELTMIIEPQDHTGEYERALKMLGLSVDDVIELDEQRFRCLVQDEWEWSRQWAMSNSGYVSSPKFAKWTE